MKSIKILLEKTSEVKEFVAITQNYDGAVSIKSGHYVVDAKSILGIYSLDLSQPVVVEIYNDDCAALLAELKKFEA